MSTNHRPQLLDGLVGIRLRSRVAGALGQELSARRAAVFALSISEPAVVYSNTVRFSMNDLRKGRWSELAGVISESGSRRFQGAVLLAKGLRRCLPDHPLNLISDRQSHIKRWAF